ATLLCLVSSVLALSCGLRNMAAQEENKPIPEAPAAKNEHRAPTGASAVPDGLAAIHPYRVDFLITELDEAKKVNSRHYSMLLNAGNWNQIKIGTRVPVSPTQGSFQYIDLGTSINCKLIESGDN